MLRTEPSLSAQHIAEELIDKGFDIKSIFPMTSKNGLSYSYLIVLSVQNSKDSLTPDRNKNQIEDH